MFKQITRSALRRRRTSTAVLFLLAFIAFQFISRISSSGTTQPVEQPDVLSETITPGELQKAVDVLETILVKGRASKTGYSRSNFSDGWARIGSCDVRNLVLERDLEQTEIEDGCKVLAGVLTDPYTDEQIIFVRGADTSDQVQIDHVVAVSDAWQKGAQQLSSQERFQFYNDSLNLLAVDGDANQSKGGSDAASWLPSKQSIPVQIRRQADSSQEKIQSMGNPSRKKRHEPHPRQLPRPTPPHSRRPVEQFERRTRF